MGRLVRKNLMVDPDALRDLARQRGTSESEAVREAVAFALAAEEMVAALKGLNEMGAFADIEQLFGPIPDEPAAEQPTTKARNAGP
jgi:hypothetical protein